MNYWLINHSWQSFKATKEYCGFIFEEERDKIKVGDQVVYFGDSLIFGIFEAVALVNNEFKGWHKAYPYQLKIKPLGIENNPCKGILSRTLKSKIDLQKLDCSSSNLLELTETEFEKIMNAISEGQKSIEGV